MEKHKNISFPNLGLGKVSTQPTAASKSQFLAISNQVAGDANLWISAEFQGGWDFLEHAHVILNLSFQGTLKWISLYYNHLPISSSSRSSERSRRVSCRRRWWDLMRRSSWDSCSIAPEWRHWVPPTGRRFIFRVTTKPNRWKKSRKGWYVVTWSIKCTCTQRRLEKQGTP